MYEMIVDWFTKSVTNTSPKPAATPIELPNNQIDELEYWRRSNNHCGKPIIKPIRKKNKVKSAVSSPNIPHNPSGNSRMSKITSRILIGMDRIHNIEIGKIRRRAIY